MGPASMSVSLANTGDRGGGGVLEHGGGVVDRDRRVVDTGDGHRHGGAVAAGERVGERVRGPARLGVAVVGVGFVGEAGAAAGDDDGAVGRLGDRGDHLRAVVDVGVVGQHVHRGGGGVLGTVAVSLTATGGSSTQVTVTDTVASSPPLIV